MLSSGMETVHGPVYAPVHGPVHSPQGTTSLKCKYLNQVESGHIKSYPKLASNNHLC